MNKEELEELYSIAFEDKTIQSEAIKEYIKKQEQEIERLQNIIDELEKYLEEFDFTAFICGNRKAGKSIELGARLNNDFILDKLKELKEGNKENT